MQLFNEKHRCFKITPSHVKSVGAFMRSASPHVKSVGAIHEKHPFSCEKHGMAEWLRRSLAEWKVPGSNLTMGKVLEKKKKPASYPLLA